MALEGTTLSVLLGAAPTKRCPPARNDSGNCKRCAACALLMNPRQQNSRQLADFHTLLFHRVSVAKRYRVAQFLAAFAERFEINRDSKRRSRFVLPPIT